MGKKLIEKLCDNCALLCSKRFSDFKKVFLLRSYAKKEISESATWVSGSGVIFDKNKSNVEPIDLNLGL